MPEQFAVRHDGVDRDLAGPLGPLEGTETVRSYNRLRRIEGQIRGLQRMVDEHRACGDVLTQISSVQEALRAVGRELLRDHLRESTKAALNLGEAGAVALCDDLVELVFRHGR
jgi:CsoR family transcriptional regulator, copper-sensing transcriptional repressor